jgi:hypothetical protein
VRFQLSKDEQTALRPATSRIKNGFNAPRRSANEYLMRHPLLVFRNYLATQTLARRQ